MATGRLYNMSGKSGPRLKLVIRRLPPTLPADVFWAVVEPFVTDGKAVWRRYVPGVPADEYGTHPVHSRAYVLMANPEALVAFHSAFDGHIFRNKAGAEYQAVVEYAPVEKTPFKTKSKADGRQGTIDDDPDYLSFLESLDVVIATEAKPAESSSPVPPPTSTPLLDAIRAAANKTKVKAAKSKDKNKEKKDAREKKDAKEAKKSANANAKTGGGGSKPSGSPADATGARAAALAAISDAASKRAPKDTSGGVIMVAGKGREVFVSSAGATSSTPDAAGPSAPGPAANNDGKDKKKRARGKGKGKGADKEKDVDEDKEKDRPKEKSKEKGKDKDKGGKSKQKGDGASKSGITATVSAETLEESSNDPKRGSRHGRGRGGRGSGRGDRAGQGPGAGPGGGPGGEGGKESTSRGGGVASENAAGNGDVRKGRADGVLPTEARIDM